MSEAIAWGVGLAVLAAYILFSLWLQDRIDAKRAAKDAALDQQGEDQ